MASLRLRSSLFTLPPNLRTSVYQQSRCFSASPKPQADVASIIISGPIFLLDTLHAVGLPWACVIPLSAALVRGVLVYRLITLPAQRFRPQQTHLMPLAVARTARLTQEEASGIRRMLPPLQSLANLIYSRFKLSRELRSLSRKFGGPPWWSAWLNFWVLITMAETVRIKSGSQEGLLSTLVSPIQWLGSKLGITSPTFSIVPPVVAPPPVLPSMSRDDMLVAKVESLHDAHLASNSGVATATSSAEEVVASSLAPAVHPYADSTMHAEGFGWCTDLTLPDSTFILPTIFFLTLVGNQLFTPAVGTATPASQMLPAGTDGELDPDSPAAKVLSSPRRPLLPSMSMYQRVGLTFGIAFWYVSLQFPAAILLYLIPNNLIGMMQRRWLMLKYPVYQPIQSCRRPLRRKVLKMWTD